MKLAGIKFWLTVICSIMMITAVSAGTHEEKMKEGTSESLHKTHEKESKAQLETPPVHQSQVKMESRIEGRAEMLQSADNIMSMAVRNNRGKMLGMIEDVVLDGDRQTIEYVVLSSNSTLHPVPWSAFDTGKETYTLDVDTKDLRNAPMISMIEMSQLNRPDFRRQAHDFYARQISAMQIKHKAMHPSAGMRDESKAMSQAQPADLYAINEIIGLDVNDMDNQKLGEFNDIVFDVRQGNLAYMLVSFGRVIGSRTYEKIAAAPWHSVRLNMEYNNVMLDADRAALQASVLPSRNLKMLCEPTFARQVHQGYDQEPYWEVFGFIAPSGIGTEMTSMRVVHENVKGSAWQDDSVFNKSFDADTTRKFNAKVIKVDTFSLGEDASLGLRVKVRTDQGKVVNVYTGPCPYYFKQELRFDRDDPVTITGCPAMVGQKYVMMASQIDRGDDTFTIRDIQGVPSWSNQND
ncbi:MAG: PRC-barrel domain-containing protein [Planctomycetota bacterium]|jgi:sporulation protein YlmC with PRC-barrel domain